MATSIHPTAVVEPGAQLGADCKIQAYAIVTRHCVLGDRVVVHPFTVLGGDPQYLKFDPATPTAVKVGTDTVIREHVTINRSIHAGQATVVGEHCFLMMASHVGHDCVVGGNVVLANNVMLAGHVSVGDHSFVGGGAGIHQFCRIGESVMVAGLARITRDVAHFVMVAERDEVIGLNVVGLKRRGLGRPAIVELKAAFHEIYFTPGNIRAVAAAQLVTGKYASAEVRQFLEFFAGGTRGFALARRAAAGGTDDAG